MNLTKHTGATQILTGVTARDKWDLIDRMLDVLVIHPTCCKQADEVRALIRPTMLAREKEMSTGMGDGYAFPHARVAGFRGFAVALAIVPDGLEYEAPDGQPIRIACMVVTSKENPTVGLRAMSAVTRLLADPSVSDFFLHESDPEKVYEFLQERNVGLDIAVKARDVMRPPRVSIPPDTPLPRVTYLMLQHHVEAAPVTDDQNVVVGQITCDLLFQKGIPDFFGQLHSISFIKDFDPFEKYFEEEAMALARDIMSDDFGCVEEDSTLLEIIHLLSVYHHPKLYVLREGKLVGIVDRIAVLERILNL
ncbi:MAG: PTS sugar transporter subunit IIA [Verrucomicrobia bacterium]|nr:PTS sugar transporter subunit IIA [Verrucomicrobiota bacterium]